MKSSILEMLERVWERKASVYMDMDACIIYENKEDIAEEAWLVTTVNSVDYRTKDEFISGVQSYM